MTLLQAHSLSKYYGGIRAVDDVSFTLNEGETRALIGPNGAGKSTFVSLLSGRVRPTAGKVEFRGRDITPLAAHERAQLGIAYTFQITSVFANLDCYQNVELAVLRQQTLAARRGSGGVIRSADLPDQILSVLSGVGLDAHAATLAGNLAYGHQRLLELAMGLALQPVLLMLDEPTRGLADAEIDNFIELIRQLAERSTVLIIEHNMAVVMALAEQITVLDNGQLLAEGTPAEIQANEQVQRAYLGQ